MDPRLARLPVVQSLLDLGAYGCAEELALERLGTTFIMAQQACWLDLQHFAVGRWDGTLSIFNKTTSTTTGPVITTAATAPADQGVQMISWIAPNTFISSNDGASMVVWASAAGTFQDISVQQTLSYDASFGVANCATAVTLGSTLYLATGHERGFLLLWRGNANGSSLALISAVDLTCSNPVNPWNLQNIRGASWFISDACSAQVVTGSENGELCIVDVPSGKVLSRTLFNPAAKRGINALSVAGQNLLVANCSVGSADKNLWYYWINANDWSIELRDSVNLIVDTSRAQVFNFDVTWGWNADGLCFFSATEEGELWMGTTVNDRLSIAGHNDVAVADLGAALAAGIGSVVYVAYNVTAFDTISGGIVDRVNKDPNRVDWAL